MLPIEAHCRVCGVVFEPVATYQQFLTDFEQRVGWAFDGRTPGWVRYFCSEPCRYRDTRARAKVQTDNQARRPRRR